MIEGTLYRNLETPLRPLPIRFSESDNATNNENDSHHRVQELDEGSLCDLFEVVASEYLIFAHGVASPMYALRSPIILGFFWTFCKHQQ